MNEKIEPLEIENDESGEDGKRQRSTIGFPYTDYENSAAVANAIHGNVGHGECSSGQLVVVRGKPPEADKHKTGGSDGGGSDLHLDPLLMALLRKIPKTEEGWTADKRLRWFKTFAMNVSQVYDDGNNPVELEIKLNDAGAAG